MKIKTIASLEKKRLETENQHILNKLSQLPEGEIRFHKSKGAFRRRHVVDGSSLGNKGKLYVSLRKNDQESVELARQLCLKHFLQKQLSLNLSRLQILDRLLLLYQDEQAAVLPDPDMCEDYHQLLDTYFAPKRAVAERWASAPYERSQTYPERLLFKANNGVCMRSKSEVLIGNKLLERGMPFHYEQTLHCGETVCYPDFTILNPLTMEIIIWEHFGLMDQESYIRNNIDKFALYCRNGYYYGKDLIVTFESRDAPLREETVELIIDEVFGNCGLMI